MQKKVLKPHAEVEILGQTKETIYCGGVGRKNNSNLWSAVFGFADTFSFLVKMRITE